MKAIVPPFFITITKTNKAQPIFTMVRLAIIEADTPAPQVLAKHGSYGAIFTRLLAASGLPSSDSGDSEHVISVHHVVEHPDNLPSLTDAATKPDAVLISGSKHNAYADVDWINALSQFAANAYHAGVKVVGICFGQQVLARGLGADVGVNPNGWEVSSTAIELTPEAAKLFFPSRGETTIHIMQMHRDVVHTLPPGMSLLAKNNNTAVQGFYAPGKVFAVQGHPEFTSDMEQVLIQMRMEQGIIPEQVAKEGLDKAEAQNDGPEIARAIVRFLLE